MPIGGSHIGSHSQTSGPLDVALLQYEVPTLVAVKADMRYHVINCKQYVSSIKSYLRDLSQRSLSYTDWFKQVWNETCRKINTLPEIFRIRSIECSADYE